MLRRYYNRGAALCKLAKYGKRLKKRELTNE